MRILIGIIEVANNIKEFADAINNSNKHKADTIAIVNSFYNNTYTYTINSTRFFNKNKKIRILNERLLLVKYFFKILFKYDVFVFIYSITFLPLKLDLLILRLLKKRIIIFNCGDDVRYRPIQYKIGIQTGEIEYLKNSSAENKIKFLKGGNSFYNSFFTQKLEEWYGCTIVSMRNQATFSGTWYHPFKFPTKSIVEEIKNTNLKPKIVHAPSDSIAKRSDIVIKTIEILKKEGLEFEFELIQNKTNQFVLDSLKDTDIVIDQCSDWIAKFAAEGMAAGCAIVGGNNYLYEGFNDESPVIQFTTDEILNAKNIRKIIIDHEYRQTLMIKSYQYWKLNYSQQAFSDYFETILDGSAPKIHPIVNYKKMLLQESENGFQWIIIKFFY